MTEPTFEEKLEIIERFNNKEKLSHEDVEYLLRMAIKEMTYLNQELKRLCALVDKTGDE